MAIVDAIWENRQSLSEGMLPLTRPIQWEEMGIELWGHFYRALFYDPYQKWHCINNMKRYLHVYPCLNVRCRIAWIWIAHTLEFCLWFSWLPLQPMHAISRFEPSIPYGTAYFLKGDIDASKVHFLCVTAQRFTLLSLLKWILYGTLGWIGTVSFKQGYVYAVNHKLSSD